MKHIEVRYFTVFFQNPFDTGNCQARRIAGGASASRFLQRRQYPSFLLHQDAYRQNVYVWAEGPQWEQGEHVLGRDPRGYEKH